jgi:hypothetical protein
LSRPALGGPQGTREWWASDGKAGSFRIDRTANPAVLDRTFVEEAGKTLEDFISRVVKD